MQSKFLDIFLKNTHIKFHENLSSDSRAVPSGRADGRRDMTELMIPFRKFANASKTNTECLPQ